ncbi:PREDICTED: antichymotrypsin-2-like [Papilio polytes]|uniref:antichymotrypsin-2-like n=1 Tax=Papilio polytes TaxID=76194 RepID=UPI000675EA6D|nr:PREDICTED: antichymotrypsin-2-like [Papilio polytes]
MKTIFFVVLVCLATVSCYKDAQLLTEGNSKFTAKMFSEVAKQSPEKSFVLSAFSVLSPLAQLALGSEGESHDELLRAIGLPDDRTIKTAFMQLNNTLSFIEGVDLRMANKIYVANGYSLKKDYTAVVRETFQSEVKTVDFTASQRAADEINTWVEQQTNGRIKDLVDPDSFNTLTRALLVNAIYFLGTWKHPFYERLTLDSNFYLPNGKTIQLPTMFNEGLYNYVKSEELNASILELPYIGDETSLYIILPNKVEGINEVLENLKDFSVLEKALNNLHKKSAEISIPKFKTETKTNLKEILQQIGVQGIFNFTKANFNKILTDIKHDLYINGATQKAFIEINERGTEATAANDFDMVAVSRLVPDVSFHADHPFVYVLKTGRYILFTGVFHP